MTSHCVPSRSIAVAKAHAARGDEVPAGFASSEGDGQGEGEGDGQGEEAPAELLQIFLEQLLTGCRQAPRATHLTRRYPFPPAPAPLCPGMAPSASV